MSQLEATAHAVKIIINDNLRPLCLSYNSGHFSSTKRKKTQNQWLVYDWFIESTKLSSTLKNVPLFGSRLLFIFHSAFSVMGSLFQKIHKTIFNKMCAFIVLGSKMLE